MPAGTRGSHYVIYMYLNVVVGYQDGEVGEMIASASRLRLVRTHDTTAFRGPTAFGLGARSGKSNR